MKKLMHCNKCGTYTLSKIHCNEKTASAHPPLFNPNDPYGKYRRRAKGISDDD